MNVSFNKNYGLTQGVTFETAKSGKPIGLFMIQKKVYYRIYSIQHFLLIES